MEESIGLFKAVLNHFHTHIKSASIILLLNKTDLLEEKIKYSDLADYFPEFTGEYYCQ